MLVEVGRGLGPVSLTFCVCAVNPLYELYAIETTDQQSDEVRPAPTGGLRRRVEVRGLTMGTRRRGDGAGTSIGSASRTLNSDNLLQPSSYGKRSTLGLHRGVLYINRYSQIASQTESCCIVLASRNAYTRISCKVQVQR